MIELSIERINDKSPYEVIYSSKGYEFHTSQHVLYRIKFIEEKKIGGCNTSFYYFHGTFICGG